MLTREQIEEIQAESEKGIFVKRLLQEKGIPDYRNFWWKRKYSKPEVPEGFLPMAGGGLPAAMAHRMLTCVIGPRLCRRSLPAP